MRRGAASVRDTRFENPRLSAVGIDVLTVEDLRARAAGTLAQPERVEFHLLWWLQAGRVRHMVDFHDLTLRAGDVLFLRPGQVQQWGLTRETRGRLLLFSAEAVLPSMARAGMDAQLLVMERWPTVASPGRTAFRDALATLDDMRRDIGRFEGSGIETAILRHTLMALLLRLARAFGHAREAVPEPREARVHRLFLQALESGFMQRLTLAEYARRLGYSESTLTRACLATAGCTAKAVIDRRVALEAKRLLVHSGATVALIGHRLGFAEPSNFVKFFRRLEGTTPQAFREQALGR